MASSLAQNLASELLYQIFSDAIPSVLSPNIFSTAPLNLSLVCRSWRKTALERSDLWANLQLSYADLDRWFDAYPDRPTLSYRLLSGMWKLWIDRSHKSPLNILLELHVDPEEGIFKEARHIYQKLLENQHRWRSVTIEYMNMVDGYAASISHLTPSSLLENLSGSIHHTSLDTYATLAVGLDLSSCHRLESLSLMNSIKVAPISIELHRLRALKATSINMDGLISVLQCSSNLEELAISEDTYGQHRDPEDLRVISLPALTDMDVKLRAFDSHWRQWIALFRRLHCSTMINFRFMSGESDICSPLQAFFNRSHPPLERFYLRTMNGDEDPSPHKTAAFLDILKIVPCLVLLCVDGSLVSRAEFLQSLAKNRPDGHGLCPLLTHTAGFYAGGSFSYIRITDGRETRFPGDDSEE